VDAVEVLGEPAGARDVQLRGDVAPHPQHRRAGDDRNAAVEADARGVLAEHAAAGPLEADRERRLPECSGSGDQHRTPAGLDGGRVQREVAASLEAEDRRNAPEALLHAQAAGCGHLDPSLGGFDREPAGVRDSQAEAPRVGPELRRVPLPGRRPPVQQAAVAGPVAVMLGRHDLERIAGPLPQVGERERRAHLEAVAGAVRGHAQSPR
jgi:hypothetical protein